MAVITYSNGMQRKVALGWLESYELTIKRLTATTVANNLMRLTASIESGTGSTYQFDAFIGESALREWLISRRRLRNVPVYWDGALVQVRHLKRKRAANSE